MSISGSEGYTVSLDGLLDSGVICDVAFVIQHVDRLLLLYSSINQQLFGD